MPLGQAAQDIVRLAGAAIAATLLGLASAGCAPQGESASAPPAASDSFDFYVLSLSWSPTYCAVEGGNANRQQCGGDARHAFVVHGLWPQFEQDWPEYCDSAEPDRVPDAIVGEIIDLMPSAGLVGHQWRKHGTCSTLPQRAYFEHVRRAREAVAIPDAFADAEQPTMTSPLAVETQFIEANPGLAADGIAVSCDGGYIGEVRICMTQDLRFRACRQVDERGCRRSSATMPAVADN